MKSKARGGRFCCVDEVERLAESESVEAEDLPSSFEDIQGVVPAKLVRRISELLSRERKRAS